MWKKFALHTWTLETTPLMEQLRIVRATGWDAIEFRHRDFVRAQEVQGTAANAIDVIKNSGVPVACIGVKLGWMFAEGAVRRQLLQAFAETCRWAVALECQTVMSPVDSGRGEIAQAVDSVREVGDIAAAYGVRLALEFNSQAEQFNSLESVREVLDGAGHPHCGILLDTYHLHRSGGYAKSLGRAHPEEIIYVHYSDVPAHGVKSGKVVDRVPPGQGVVRFGEILRWLAGGYIGYLSYEAPNPLSWERNAESVALEARDASRKMLTRLNSGS